MPIGENYVVYILECVDGTLYTGVTTDLKRRLRQHLEGTGAKYTRGRGPLKLRLAEGGKSRSDALKREREIKDMTREQKIRLIAERGVDGEAAKEL